VWLIRCEELDSCFVGGSQLGTTVWVVVSVWAESQMAS
jgi:hypothetical protein